MLYMFSEMYILLFSKMYILLFFKMYILKIPGGVPDPLPIPSSSAPNYIQMDKRVHGQKNDLLTRWPRRKFQAGV